MNVLHTIASMDIKAGGPTTSTRDLVAGLNALGCHADILTIQTRGNDSSSSQPPFIKTVPFDLKTPLQISSHCRRFLRQNRQYDLYHSNGLWLDINHATCSIARKFGKPCVLSLHGMLYPQALERSAWKKKLMLLLGHRSDIMHSTCIHATCVQEMEHYRRMGFRNPVAVIPNPFPIPAYIHEIKRSCDRFRIGYLGRLHPYKNVDRLIDAWAKIEVLADQGELLIMGTGESDYVQQLKNQAKRLQIKNIHFTGEISGRQKFEYLASLTALCLPSRSENFGMVVPEALITGTPVIATDTSPWEELNTFRCGWWCNNDTDTLAERIKNIFQLDLAERNAMGRRGRELVMMHYDAKNIAAKMNTLYLFLLNLEEQPEWVYL